MTRATPVLRVAVRLALAAIVPAGAVLAGTAVMVRAGEAVVITEPGLSWKLPAPLQSTIPVDLRPRTSSARTALARQ